MSRFEWKVWLEGKNVKMKIINQPEELRGKGHVFKYKKFEITSDGSPELRDSEIYIRGTLKEFDDCVSIKRFGTAKEADEYCREVMLALTVFRVHLDQQDEKEKDILNKIKYQFDRIGCIVVAIPLHIPEWAKRNGRCIYKNHNFNIKRGNTSAIYIDDLYLPGITDEDPLRPAGFRFNDEKDARTWIDRAAQAIKECNEEYITNDNLKIKAITKETIITE